MYWASVTLEFLDNLVKLHFGYSRPLGHIGLTEGIDGQAFSLSIQNEGYCNHLIGFVVQLDGRKIHRG